MSQRRGEQIGIGLGAVFRAPLREAVQPVPVPAMPRQLRAVPRIGGQPLEKIVLLGRAQTPVATQHPAAACCSISSSAVLFRENHS